MIMKPNNPFILSGYNSPQYFCDRKEETDKLISSIMNSRNTTLISLRRMGKTGLIHHVFNRLEKDKSLSLFYLDILPATTLNDFINIMSNSLISKLSSKSNKFVNHTLNFFKSLRPVITYNSISGEPSLEFDIKTEKEASETLEEIFNYIKKKDSKVVIAIDEFQQILNFPEKNTEAILRSNIQKVNDASFVFSGSQKHLLTSIFGNYSRPFYQSTETMYLKEININEFIKFIKNRFKEGGKKIEEEEVKMLLEWTRNHTFYVQYICNKLYGINDKTITKAIIQRIFSEILKENEPIYYNYRNLLTEYQFKLLKAIAKENAVAMPNSKDFIYKYKLNSPSSVESALKPLSDKEMIYYEEGKYLVYDVFLSRWLEQY